MGIRQVTGNMYVCDDSSISDETDQEIETIIGVDGFDHGYSYIPIYDPGSDITRETTDDLLYDQLRMAVSEALAARLQRDTVLIYGESGTNKSVAVAVATIAIINGLDWDEVFATAESKHPTFNPDDEFISKAKKCITEYQ